MSAAIQHAAIHEKYNVNRPGRPEESRAGSAKRLIHLAHEPRYQDDVVRR
jgi:hypothetical protein